MNDTEHIALLEETAASLRRMRTDEGSFLTGALEILESVDGVVFVPHRRGTAFIGKFLRVQVGRILLTMNDIRPGTLLRGIGAAARTTHYPVWTVMPDGVLIPGINLQISMSARFVSWLTLADEWEMFACPPWDFWQPCFHSGPSPQDDSAVAGVGPRRVNLEDGPSQSPVADPAIPF